MTDFHPVAAVLCANPPPPPPPPPADAEEQSSAESTLCTPMSTRFDFDGRTEGERFIDADEAAFEEFEKTRPPPPVVTKPLTQYTSLVPTHSDGCEIPGFGPDTDDTEPAAPPVASAVDFTAQQPLQQPSSFADANQQHSGDIMEPAPFFPTSTEAADDVGSHFPPPQQQQQQPPSFLQQIVADTHVQPTAGTPTPNYVNPFAQPVRSAMHFPPSMDAQHLMQHVGQQHMSFPPHMHPFTTRPPPSVMMQHMQQQQHQHFGGPQPSFMPSSAFPPQLQQQQHPQQQLQQHLQHQMQQQPPPQQQQPPPQVPLQHLQHPPPQLHSIPPPNPMQLNKIPPPRALDLAAIPEPQFNLEAIKVPDGQQDIISRG